MVATLKQYGQLYDSKSAKAAVESALAKTQVYGIGLLQGYTPVRTGRLKAGWSVIREGQGLTWANATPYGAYLEFGTRFMKPRPMLTPAIPQIKDYFRKTLVASIGRKAATSIVSTHASPTTFARATAGYTGKKP